MDLGKPPIIFENPTYTSRDTAVKVAQPTATPVRNHSPCCQDWLLLDLVLWNNVPLGSSQPSLHGRKHTGRFLSFTPCSNRTDPRTEGLKTIRILGFGNHSGGADQEPFHPEWSEQEVWVHIQRLGKHTVPDTRIRALCKYLWTEWVDGRQVIMQRFGVLGTLSGFWLVSQGCDLRWPPCLPLPYFSGKYKGLQGDRQIHKFPLMRPYYSLIFKRNREMR